MAKYLTAPSRQSAYRVARRLRIKGYWIPRMYKTVNGLYVIKAVKEKKLFNKFKVGGFWEKASKAYKRRKRFWKNGRR